MGYSPWSRHESVTTERLHFHFSLSRNEEGNGNPLQCSCLENPRDGRAWWAAVYGVAQSRTRLMRLSSRIGGMPSVVPVSLGCCEHNEVGTEQEENEGMSGPLSLSTTTCSPMKSSTSQSPGWSSHWTAIAWNTQSRTLWGT